MEIARQSSGKRYQVFNGERSLPSFDRFSALPDDVTCHILSFLPTNMSVSTSILAKRWRFLWAHVPILDFESEGHRHLLGTEFSSTVNRVLVLHKSKTLNTFRLAYSHEFDSFDYREYTTCITTAIERNVQSLDLDLAVELPQSVLTCKTLIELRMGDGVGIPSSGTIYLPRLKKLFFGCTKYNNLLGLLSGCPVLEELIIDGTPEPGPNSECCNISLLTLKRLTIRFPYGNPKLIDSRVKINTPALRYLDLQYCSCDHMILPPLTSLVEADIWFYTSANNDLYPGSVLKFLNSLYNVKCLILSSSYLGNLDLTSSGSVVKFDNLTKLELDGDCRLLTKFLEIADHLEVLHINELYQDLEGWREPMEKRYACLLHSLRNVTVKKNFRCKKRRFNMIKYILRNALVLKRMEICCEDSPNLKARFDTIQRISLFPRGSKECELAFS